MKVSFVIPALNEEGYIEDTLDSLEKQEGDFSCETVVVDGGSTDRTLEIAEQRADMVVKDVVGRGNARNVGAERSSGEYIFFVDSDTVLDSECVDSVIEFMEKEGLDAASAKFSVTGLRGKVLQLVGNIYFSRREPVLLPGFFTAVRSESYEKLPFENVVGEDLEFSERLGSEMETAIIDRKLVTTSGRRFSDMGLTGTLLYYLGKSVTLKFERKTGFRLWNPSRFPI